MTLADRLEALRRDVPRCVLVSFGDMQTGLALRTSASRPYKQDYLERIMGQATKAFALSDGTDTDNDRVLVATADEIRIFVRSPFGNSDLLCCVCHDAGGIDHATGAARRFLNDISGAV